MTNKSLHKVLGILGITFSTSLVIILFHFITGQVGWKIAVGIATFSLIGMLAAYMSSENLAA